MCCFHRHIKRLNGLKVSAGESTTKHLSQMQTKISNVLASEDKTSPVHYLIHANQTVVLLVIFDQSSGKREHPDHCGMHQQ